MFTHAATADAPLRRPAKVVVPAYAAQRQQPGILILPRFCENDGQSWQHHGDAID